MKKTVFRFLALVLALASVLSLAACGGEEETKKTETVDGSALFQALLENVAFDTEIADVGESASLYFSRLPATAQVRLYTGSAYYADCLAMITVADPSTRKTAVESLNIYMNQMTDHFRNYQPDQVPKFEDAVIWESDVYAILCVSGDSQTANKIVKNAVEYAAKYTGSQNDTPVVTQPQQTEPQQTESQATGEYPVLTSKSGTLNSYGNGFYRVDDMAFEGYNYDANAAQNYANILNSAASQLGSDINVYSILIPTAIGIVLPDDVRANASGLEDQNARMNQVFGMMDESIHKVHIYDNLMQHRDEYLYFRTDFHWNGAAAYYAYEVFCQEKGITPYTLDQRRHSEFDSFKGGLYVDDQVTADVVHAYHPYYGDDISMVFTDRNGTETQWSVIMDVSGWADSSKYNTFAGGDNPITVYENPHVTEGVAIVIKESFGNALIPYLVDHYKTVYEIDYRYWEGNIADFAHEKGVTDVIFANNMGMVRAATLVAMLSDNF